MDEKLALWLEKMNFQDWLNMQMDTKLLIRQNFIAGIARGLGMALGGTFILGVLTAIVLFVKGLFS
jgi:uncharacterized protein DUF5665